MPHISPILLAWEIVGSFLPCSHRITVFSDTPHSLANARCVNPAFFLAAAMVIFCIANCLSSLVVAFSYIAYGISVILC